MNERPDDESCVGGLSLCLSTGTTDRKVYIPSGPTRVNERPDDESCVGGLSFRHSTWSRSAAEVERGVAPARDCCALWDSSWTDGRINLGAGQPRRLVLVRTTGPVAVSGNCFWIGDAARWRARTPLESAGKFALDAFLPIGDASAPESIGFAWAGNKKSDDNQHTLTPPNIQCLMTLFYLTW